MRSQSQGILSWLTHWNFFQHFHGSARPNKRQVRQRGLRRGSLNRIWNHLLLKNVMAVVNTTGFNAQLLTILDYSAQNRTARDGGHTWIFYNSQKVNKCTIAWIKTSLHGWYDQEPTVANANYCNPTLVTVPTCYSRKSRNINKDHLVYFIWHLLPSNFWGIFFSF